MRVSLGWEYCFAGRTKVDLEVAAHVRSSGLVVRRGSFDSLVFSGSSVGGSAGSSWSCTLLSETVETSGFAVAGAVERPRQRNRGHQAGRCRRARGALGIRVPRCRGWALHLAVITRDICYGRFMVLSVCPFCASRDSEEAQRDRWESRSSRIARPTPWCSACRKVLGHQASLLILSIRKTPGLATGHPGNTIVACTTP